MGRLSLARKLATSLLVAFLVGALAAAAIRLRPAPDPDAGPAESSAAGADRLELALFDALERREAARRPASPDLVLVTVDEASVKRARETAGGWPWPRQYLGTLVGELRRLGARLVVLDAAFSDASRFPRDDAEFARALGAAGEVVAGFAFAEAPEEGTLEPGRWAILEDGYPTRGEALLAAGPLLAEGGRPYLVPAGERIELWLGGYRDRADAQRDAERLRAPLNLGRRDTPTLRELKAEEALDRVTVDVLFAERHSVALAGPAAAELKTFQNLQAPVAELAGAAEFGNLRLARDEDGVVRGVRHLWRHEGRYYPSLALAAAMALTDERELEVRDGRLRLGGRSVPVDGQGLTRLRFYGPREGAAASPYPVVPVLSIVRSAQRRAEGKSQDDRLAERIRNKVAFVSFEVADCERARTPIARAGLRTAAWATALDNLLRGEGLARATADQDAAVAFSMALLGAFVSLLFTRGTRPWRTAVFEFAAAGLLVAGFVTWAYRAYRAGLWVGTVVPLLAFFVALGAATFVNYADEVKAVAHIREALGRYALPALVEQLLRRPQHLAREGERRAVTTVVIDLAGFPAACEALKPRDLVRLLEEYMAVVWDGVGEHRGQIDRVVGAQVVAYWGAPLPNPRHALDAARCALALRAAIAKRGATWWERYGVKLAPHLGVCSGELVVGNLSGRGSRGRPRFSVFGPPMAFAEELAASAAALKVGVVACERTAEAAREELALRELDLVRAPFGEAPLRVLELRSLRKKLPEAEADFVARFEKGVAAFRARAFAPALEAFEALARERPDDGPTALYLERCQACLASPPGEDWDGVFERRRGRPS